MALHVAVIGSRGFVGGALARTLRAAGDFRVTELARPQFDLEYPGTFGQIPADADVVVHAAGAIGKGLPTQDFWNANVISTHELVAQLNARERQPWFLYLSTGAVNGAASGVVAEGAEPRPEGVYALTKYLAEEVVRKTYLGAWAIARLYFPYGPGQGPTRLIPGLIDKIRSGKQVTLNQGGHPKVSPVFIDDMADYLSRLVQARPTGIFNVAGESQVLIAEIVALIEAEIGKRAEVHESGLLVGDFCAPDCLGSRQTSLRAGIAATIRSFRGR